ncbi:MAG: PD40 domain-containing protein [Anaerolineales bacterium]|nr:PD40 domain-containing protein [Anaerolineales bacterium]
MSDCHKIAFAMFNFNVKEPPDIYTICPDGSGLTRITNHPNADETPAWSPDGQRLAFVSNRTGSYQIFIVDSDGGNINQVTTDYDNSLPIWLPDGQHIAFRTTDNEGLWWWRKAKLDGSEVEKISEASYDFFYQTPAWSPDGKKMAYMSLEEQKERNDGSSQIHIKNLDGTNDMALTHDTWENASPVWSPDGKNIAFVSEMHGEYNIFALYIMRSDGSKVKQLTRPVYTDVSAIFSWSPDGKQIAIGDINIGRISIISVSNGESRELYYPKEGEAIYAPAWQP